MVAGRHWDHLTCKVCEEPIQGDVRLSCTQCSDYDVCEGCFDSEDCKEVDPHEHSHPMLRVVCTEEGLPYVFKSSVHEHLLLQYYQSPAGTTCDVCSREMEESEHVFSCNECEGFAMCGLCLVKTLVGDAITAKVEVEKLETAKKGDQSERNAKIVESVKAIQTHRHDLSRYPKSPYGNEYGCDICGETFSSVVYHCEDCGNYDLCPSCYTPEVMKEQADGVIQSKMELVDLLNVLQPPAEKYETRTPNKDDEIHYVFSCDACKVENITGPIYSCLVCEIYLCAACLDANCAPFKKIKHQPDHPMERRRAPNVMNNPATIPHNVQCDGCEAPVITGTRYRCTECLTYNWCESCYKRKYTTKEHDLFHTMQVLLGPGITRELIHRPCKICTSPTSYGAMLKCNVCVNYQVCKACFVTGVSSEHHKVLHSLSYLVVGQDELAHKKRPKINDHTIPHLIGDETLQDVIDACKADVKAIVEKCKESGTKFTDEDFPTNEESLFRDPENPPEDWISPKDWRRITEICTQPVLFSAGITPDDVDQGAIGTCYLLGDLSGIAQYPHLISQLVVEYNIEIGVFGVRFFINNKWEYVIIDDYVPCNENKRPLYGCCTDRNEIWVMVIEKAYAKLHGCYENINGGMERLAFSDLTGGVAQRIVIPNDLVVHSDGTTGKRPPLDSRVMFTDDSLDVAHQAGFSSASFGTWKGVIRWNNDPTKLERIELVIAFAAGRVEGGGKNLDTKTQYTLNGATDAINHFMWFVIKEVIYLPTTRPKPMLFMGLYNGDSLSIQGDWMSLDLSAVGNFLLTEDVDISSNLTNRIGPFSSIWDILNIKHKDHVLMSCSIDDINAAIEEKTDTGLLKNHAYSLINFYKLEKDLLLVKLRNPHGRAGWTGPWVKGGPEWTEERIKQVGDYNTRENGEFYVEFTYFISLFNSIDMCRLFTDQWTLQVRECEFTPLMCGGDLYWLENPQFRITPQERGKFVISMSQPDVKIYSGDDLYPIPIGFRVVYLPYPTDRVREATGVLVVCHVVADSQKSVSIEIELDALDESYFVIPYTKQPGKHLPFHIAVYSTAEFELSDMSYMEDPMCHPIPSGPWLGTLQQIGSDQSTAFTMAMYFDAPRASINGVGTDDSGKYFVLGKFKMHDGDDDVALELQLSYLQMRSAEAPPDPFYIYGNYSKTTKQFSGFFLIDAETQTVNLSLTLVPVDRTVLPNGYYEGSLTIEGNDPLSLSINSLIFHNNLVFGSDFMYSDKLQWFSLYGEMDGSSITICQMEHGSTEFMYFGEIGEDKESFSGRMRGVLNGTFLDGKFELKYSPEKTQDYIPEAVAAEDGIDDPLAEWYFQHRVFEILEYFVTDAITSDDKETVVQEIAEMRSTKKHYLDRIQKHAAKPADGADKAGFSDAFITYTRKEMVRLGRNEMSRFGRAEMARFGRAEVARFGRNEMSRFGRNEMSRFGRNEMSRFGRNEMSRFGRNEMKRFGRNEMKRFGRNEMKRFGRNEMKRFGRNEMKRFGRKERDDAEYDQHEQELKEAQVAAPSTAQNGEDFENEYLQQQLQLLESQLQEERQKSQSLELAVSNLQQLQKQGSQKQLSAPKTALKMEQKILDLEARLNNEREKAKKFQAELAKLQEVKEKFQKERENSKTLQLRLSRYEKLEGRESQPTGRAAYKNVSAKVDSGSKVILPRLTKKA